MQVRPYQVDAVEWLAPRTRALLALEMRLGKSMVSILAARKIGAQRIVVTCPAIAVPQWCAEWPRWWPGCPPAAAIDAEGYTQSPVKPGITVVSYDRAKRNVEALRAAKWDVFIPDEAHFAKNPAAARTALVYGKSGIGWQSRCIWALSGTPAPNHAAELWPMLRAFGAVGMTYDEFVRRYCNVNYEGKIIGTKGAMIPELRGILAKVMLRRKRKEVAPEMPALSVRPLYVSPDISALCASEELAHFDEMLAKTPEHQRAALLASLENQHRELRISVALAKVPALVDEITSSIDGMLYDQTVVFGYHVEPLDVLRSRLAAKGVTAEVICGKTPVAKRTEIMDRFRRGGLQVVVAQIIAAGTAIDLSAASHGYMIEWDWVPGNNEQAMNRLVSMTKHEPITFDSVTWEGSADEKVQRTLTRKTLELSQLY